MTIQTKPVTSSQIKEIGWDEASETVAILFHSGGLYHYRGFTKEKWMAFATAESIGSHFYKHIKRDTLTHPYQKQ